MRQAFMWLSAGMHAKYVRRRLWPIQVVVGTVDNITGAVHESGGRHAVILVVRDLIEIRTVGVHRPDIPLIPRVTTHGIGTVSGGPLEDDHLAVRREIG